MVGDTVWITALLLQSGRFNAEFFYLYFFVLLLAAIGENLRLIAIGAVADLRGVHLSCSTATGGTWSLWNSPSLIRIPFLFTAAAFYGYLVERTRSERWRAEATESERQRAEAALSSAPQQLRDEAACRPRWRASGSELISSLDRPVLLERVCQVTTEELGCVSSHTLLRRPEDARLRHRRLARARARGAASSPACSRFRRRASRRCCDASTPKTSSRWQIAAATPAERCAGGYHHC